MLPTPYEIIACLLLAVAALLNLSKTRSRRLTPKDRPETRKRFCQIATRGHLKRRNNALKVYNSKYSRRQMEIFAAECAARQRSNPTPAVKLVCGALMELGIRFRLEEIVWYDGCLFVLVDIWLPDHKRGLELDGRQHRRQHVYDAEKDKMVLEVTGFSIYRRWNSWALKPGLTLRIKDELGL